MERPTQVTPLPPSVASVIDRYHADVAAARLRAEARLARLPEAASVGARHISRTGASALVPTVVGLDSTRQKCLASAVPMQVPTAPNVQEPYFLTLPEASRRVGLSIDTIRRRVKDGSIPSIFLAGKYRIRVDHLDAWAEGHTR